MGVKKVSGTSDVKEGRQACDENYGLTIGISLLGFLLHLAYRWIRGVCSIALLNIFTLILDHFSAIVLLCSCYHFHLNMLPPVY